MGRLFGGIFLVAGTSIGAGMLALPIVTANMGFYPASFTFISLWAFTALSALLILEASLWHHGETNLVTMAGHTLGKAGKMVAWLIYLGLSYSLLAAYITGGAALFSEVLLSRLGINLADGSIPFLFLFIFGGLVFWGMRPVDLVNRWFFIGLIGLYIVLITMLSTEVSVDFLVHSDASYIWMAVPVIVTAFGFHVVIPSLKTYLKNNVKELRLSLVLGSLLALIIYLIWIFVILAVLPAEGEASLAAIAETGQPAAALGVALETILNNTWIGAGMLLFSFFAVITSFLGVSISANHFLMDGFNVEYNLSGRLKIFVMTYLPPLLFAFYYPQGFIMALGFAGAFVAILFMIVPAMMVWRGRYQMQLTADYRLSGGRLLLLAVMLAGLFIVYFEVLPK